MLGTKGQRPAGQPWQGLGQILRTRQGGGQPGTGCGHAEVMPGGGIPRLWGRAELAAGQNVGPVSVHLSQSSERVPGPRKTNLGCRACSESEEITEWGESGKGRNQGAVPTGERPGPRGSTREGRTPKRSSWRQGEYPVSRASVSSVRPGWVRLLERRPGSSGGRWEQAELPTPQPFRPQG